MEMNGGFLVTKINSLETGFSRRFSVKRILMRLMELRDVFFMSVAGGWYLNRVTLD